MILCFSTYLQGELFRGQNSLEGSQARKRGLKLAVDGIFMSKSLRGVVPLRRKMGKQRADGPPEFCVPCGIYKTALTCRALC